MYDYSIRFGNEYDLIDKWAKLQIKISRSSLERNEVVESENIGFDADTTSFLQLLRFFSMKKSFELTVNKLIIYSDVGPFSVLISFKNSQKNMKFQHLFSQDVNGCPESLIQKKTIHPYIIAVGLTKENITNYYIDIEEHLIPVKPYILH